MKFKATSNDDRKLELNWTAINTYIARWGPGTEFEIEIVKRQPKRSDPMRNYYFAVVLPAFMEHLGYEQHELELFHRQLKSQALIAARNEDGPGRPLAAERGRSPGFF